MFKVIDLFSGCGGFAQAVKNLGWEVVFSCEIDKFARQAYEANFEPVSANDIKSVDVSDIPDADFLLAGFPCPAFSISGVSVNNALGRKHGFEHVKGDLFFEVLRVLEAKQPRYALLENVKNLIHHDKGRTFKVVLDELKAIGYHVDWFVRSGEGYVPQKRERVFLACFKNRDDFNAFNQPVIPTGNKKLSSILEHDVNDKYTLSDKLWSYLDNRKKAHQAKGNGFGYRSYTPTESIGTITARYYKDGSDALIEQYKKNPRKLTPRECARLMGFPESYKIVCSDTQTYKQMWNSVIVPLVESIMAQMSGNALLEELVEMLSV